MRCNRFVLEEDCSCIKHKDGTRTELVVQSNVYWLRAEVLDGKADSKWLCAMDDVVVRALEESSRTK